MQKFWVMKIWVAVGILFTFSAQATEGGRPAQKLACRASGQVGLQSVVVEPTDLTGQIVAISVDSKGAMSFFASNGSIEDASIFVKTTFSKGWGEDTVYLKRSLDQKGATVFTLEEWTVCDPDDQEFCYGRYKEPRLSRSDRGVTCQLLTE